MKHLIDTVKNMLDDLEFLYFQWKYTPKMLPLISSISIYPMSSCGSGILLYDNVKDVYAIRK